MLGAFYTVAPWPLNNLDLARDYMRKALNIAASRRNLYYNGVVAYRRKEWGDATKYFEQALNARVGSPTEADFGDFMLAESRRALKLLKDKVASEGDCTA